jgi:hypothetical protein
LQLPSLLPRSRRCKSSSGSWSEIVDQSQHGWTPCRQHNVRTKSGGCVVAQPSRSPSAESIQKVQKDAYPNQPKTHLMGRHGLREISWPVFFFSLAVPCAMLASCNVDRSETCIAAKSSIIAVPYRPVGLLNSDIKNGKKAPRVTSEENKSWSAATHANMRKQ